VAVQLVTGVARNLSDCPLGGRGAYLHDVGAPDADEMVMMIRPANGVSAAVSVSVKALQQPHVHEKIERAEDRGAPHAGRS